jgi:hypothetical protein
VLGVASGGERTMTKKEQMLDVIQKLPDDASVEEAIERLYLLRKINIGLEQVKSGDVISHEEMKRHFNVDQ